jgi:hypothetical protein
MNISKPVSVPTWLAAVIVVALIALLAGGGLGFKEHRALKKSYKDSLKVRERKLDSLAIVLEYSDDYQETETVAQITYYNDYQRELKRRKYAEAELFIYRNHSRFHIDSFLSNYNYRRNPEKD